jgi:hypothetical protein
MRKDTSSTALTVRHMVLLHTDTMYDRHAISHYLASSTIIV